MKTCLYIFAILCDCAHSQILSTPFLIQSHLSTDEDKWCISQNNSTIFTGEYVVSLTTCDYSDENQQWVVEEENGYVYSVANNRTKCLVPSHRVTHQGTGIVTFYCPPHPYDPVFKWHFGDDATIKNVFRPHLVLDVSSANAEEGTPIRLWRQLIDYNGTTWPALTWDILSTGSSFPSASPSVSSNPTNSQSPTVPSNITAPTHAPSLAPSTAPLHIPSISPSQLPSVAPSTSSQPTNSVAPSDVPTVVPSMAPSISTQPSAGVKTYFFESALSTAYRKWCMTWVRSRKSKYAKKIILTKCRQNNMFQQWEIDSNGYIRSVKNRNACLAPKRGSYKNGTDIAVYRCPLHYRRSFSWVTNTQDGTIQSARNRRMVMDVTGGRAFYGASIQLWHNFNPHQYWPPRVWNLVPTD